MLADISKLILANEKGTEALENMQGGQSWKVREEIWSPAV